MEDFKGEGKRRKKSTRKKKKRGSSNRTLGPIGERGKRIKTVPNWTVL